MATDAIYVLTVLGSHRKWDSRSWDWHSTFEEAENSLYASVDFYAECGYYDYAVIEKLEARSIGPHDEMGWYKIVYDVEATGGKRHTVEKCAKPEELKHIVNWSLG